MILALCRYPGGSPHYCRDISTLDVMGRVVFPHICLANALSPSLSLSLSLSISRVFAPLCKTRRSKLTVLRGSRTPPHPKHQTWKRVEATPPYEHHVVGMGRFIPPVGSLVDSNGGRSRECLRRAGGATCSQQPAVRHTRCAGIDALDCQHLCSVSDLKCCSPTLAIR